MVAADADIVYAFSSVSVGVPLWMSGLKHPKTLLRLGGDFLWERATDRGATESLCEWYRDRRWFQGVMNGILRTFDHIVFSTSFQQELYEKVYQALPFHSVIENALPTAYPVLHTKHDPFRLLYLGRFVAFKNLPNVLLALKELPGATLTLVGDGPLEPLLRRITEQEGLSDRVMFRPIMTGEEKRGLFLEHDLLVLPSYTEISPNTALEARSNGLPVLLTQETGLSMQLSDAMQLRVLRTPRDIQNAVREIEHTYDTVAHRHAIELPVRGWDAVAQDHMNLFRSLL